MPIVISTWIFYSVTDILLCTHQTILFFLAERGMVHTRRLHLPTSLTLNWNHMTRFRPVEHWKKWYILFFFFFKKWYILKRPHLIVHSFCYIWGRGDGLQDGRAKELKESIGVSHCLEMGNPGKTITQTPIRLPIKIMRFARLFVP